MHSFRLWLALALLVPGTLLPALSSAQTTRVDDTDPAIRYSTEHWLNAGDSAAHGRSVATSFVAGSSVSVTFKGTGIAWIGTRCRCAAGIARVYIDGNRLATVDTYAAERQAQVEIHRVSGLPDREHIFTIEVTGAYNSAGDSAYVAVDAFDIEGGSALAPADRTPPAVQLTAPASGGRVSGPIALTADATDDVWLAGVTFLVDGAAIGDEDLTVPYSVAWDTAVVAEGPHVLTVRARDWAGNLTHALPIAVRVGNGSLLEQDDPAISWKGEWIKSNDARFSGGNAAAAYLAGASATVKFKGTGITWIGYRCPCASGIARILVDGNFRETLTTYAAGQEAQVQIYRVDGLADGEHTLTLEVTGDYHLGGDSAYLVVDAFRVLSANGATGTDTTPPSVSIAPPAGATLQSVVRFTAEANDNIGIAGLRFYIDGVPLGAELTSAPPYYGYWDTTVFANGSHTVMAVARDRDGNMTVSATLNLSVHNAQDTGRPTVRLTTPGEGAVVTGMVTLAATASDNVGVTKIRFFAGDLLLGEDTTSPYSITRDSSNVPSGKRFVLKAEAVDEAGNVGTSAPINVTVQHAAAAP